MDWGLQMRSPVQEAFREHVLRAATRGSATGVHFGSKADAKFLLTARPVHTAPGDFQLSGYGNGAAMEADVIGDN
jgi:hypothetical protein